jgi:hypothetical protein
VLLGVGSSQSVEYDFGDEGPKRCWHTQGEVGQAQGMLVSLPAARFIKSNYSRDPGTVTTLLEQLELPPLSTRRKIARITLLHKAIHEKVAID